MYFSFHEVLNPVCSLTNHFPSTAHTAGPSLHSESQLSSVTLIREWLVMADGNCDNLHFRKCTLQTILCFMTAHLRTKQYSGRSISLFWIGFWSTIEVFHLTNINQLSLAVSCDWLKLLFSIFIPLKYVGRTKPRIPNRCILCLRL